MGELAKGRKQAQRATNWICFNPDDFARKAKLPVSTVRQYNFQPVVLSKTLHDSARAVNSNPMAGNVPIANEFLLRALY